MKARKNLLFVFCAAALFAGCGKTSYKKTPGGMPYKIFRSKDTQQVVPGSYLKLAVTQKRNDSVMLTTANGLPVYLFISNQNMQRYDISELWTTLHLGDSMECTQMVDTFIKRSPQSVPPQFKPGDRITTAIRVLAIFSSDSLARMNEKEERDRYLVKESAVIEKYLGEKKITTQKTPSGAYVEIIKPGEGPLIDTGNYVSINYTGTSWSGKKFDSNTDSAFHHLGPMSFVVAERPMIKGFDEAMYLLRKGSVARAYVPSMLAYGPSPTSPNIKPFEQLIFDIDVVDVQPKAPAKPTAPDVKKIDATQQNK